MRKHITKTFKILTVIPPWLFLIVVVFSGYTAIYQLRANNEHMVELKQAVYDADKNNTDVQAPLRNLQAYVTTHMNTNLQTGPNAVYPPIQLKYTYDRLVQAKSADAQKSNSEIYSDAQAYCEQQDSKDFSGHNRVPCIQQYVLSHSTASTATIPDSLYKFDFVSPVWSPDLAGWSLVVAILSAILFIFSFLYHRFATRRWI